MRHDVRLCEDDTTCEALGSFLEERIYEFNSKVTGYVDGRLLAGCVRNETGEVIEGFNGYSGELTSVWVHEQHRGQGLGAVLLRSAEAEAAARGCLRIVLVTQNFQAPGFYERMGYQRTYTIEAHPRGFEDVIYVKVLQGQQRT